MHTRLSVQVTSYTATTSTIDKRTHGGGLLYPRCCYVGKWLYNHDVWFGRYDKCSSCHLRCSGRLVEQ